MISHFLFSASNIWEARFIYIYVRVRSTEYSMNRIGLLYLKANNNRMD